MLELYHHGSSVCAAKVRMYMHEKDLDWEGPQKASLEKLISTATGNNPITIGTPAKYRKWYTDRKGKLDDY